jgi:hypothetical protein
MTAKLADDHWTMGVSHAWSMEALMKMARAEAEQAGQTDLEKAVFNGGLSPSIHLLAGYSLEVLLKCACYLHGGELKRLRSKALGHDLTALFDEAQRLGYVSSVPNLRSIAERLREAHFNHQFRYGGFGMVQMPPLAETLEALTALYNELHNPLLAALAREAQN